VKTLIRATNWIGDVAMSLPALKALRASFPSDRISVLARPFVADLYRTRHEVNEVIVEDPKGEHRGSAGRARLARELRERDFDRAILFPRSFGTALTLFRAGIPQRIGHRGEGRSVLLTQPVPAPPRREHQVWKYLKLVEAAGGAVVSSPDASWAVPDDLSRRARERLVEAGWNGEPFVAAHVASFAHRAKRWSVTRFAATFDALFRRHRLGVVLLGSAAEKGMNAELIAALHEARAVDLSGRSRIDEALGVVGLARLFVGNDSGLSHLAGAAGTPTVVVFGPTDPDATRPWDGPRSDGRPARIRVVRRRTLCAPCLHTRCPLDHRCMTGVAVADVLRACDDVM